MGRTNFCNTCCDAGYLGFLNPDGWLAGEIGDNWPFRLMIRRECPECHGNPQSMRSGSSRVPNSPAPPPVSRGIPPFVRDIMEDAGMIPNRCPFISHAPDCKCMGVSFFGSAMRYGDATAAEVLTPNQIREHYGLPPIGELEVFA
jgi:hypothetical protein